MITNFQIVLQPLKERKAGGEGETHSARLARLALEAGEVESVDLGKLSHEERRKLLFG